MLNMNHHTASPEIHLDVDHGARYLTAQNLPIEPRLCMGDASRIAGEADYALQTAIRMRDDPFCSRSLDSIAQNEILGHMINRLPARSDNTIHGIRAVVRTQDTAPKFTQP